MPWPPLSSSSVGCAISRRNPRAISIAISVLRFRCESLKNCCTHLPGAEDESSGG